MDKLDINDVISQVLALTRGELLRNDVVLHTELAAEGQPVMGDRVQFQQVLLNLVVNSDEAMSGVTERTRELTVSSTLVGPGSVLVAVKDNGSGLDRASRNACSSPSSPRTGRPWHGTRHLRSIVEAHGGRLWVSTHAPHGAGVRFTSVG